ncbi:hypothetical protein TcasGA2_TC006145 [Tribolium castaneum]|uniref:DNA-directed DNA polymerase n=1 Tax=Tribolium castaneum TaxID=7070 RepID=D6WUM0_TRICA|nr:hypothetical protein TcasGA2_TC006145 [Tribolium castaneum]
MEKLSYHQERSYKESNICHICNKTIESDQIKVRDHNHLTGKFRGPAHQRCNLNYQDSYTIPVVFHNLSGYDAHFIIKELSTAFAGNIKLLPINKEKYISFSKSVGGTNVTFRFIDSFRFMSKSLDQLSSNLKAEQKIITRKFCKTNEEFNLLIKKGVFPYDYVDSWDKLNETILPSKKDFYSTMHESNISEDSYKHAETVWQTFKIQTLGEYSDLYLRTDVILLADVFETFRETCLNTYKLDPLHYFTLPGLTFDAMLKSTGICLELLSDIDMIMFIERGIRGGVSQCSNRYAKANNHYMKDGYNSNEELSYLMYFDVNNLYGAAMSQYLPYGNFRFLEDFNITEILNTSDTSNDGYIIECDLEYPTPLHDLHSDLPLAPQHLKPPNSKSKLEKLLLTLFPKINYIVHYRNLKMYLRLGLKITKVHRVLTFNQSPWLKEYIDLNTRLRQQSQNEFEKDFFKLMINAIYMTEDIYKNIKEDIHRFDTSDYKLDNKFNIELKNKKCPGLMKDENHGKIMLEFVGLRSKMYSYTVDSDTEDEEHDYDEVGPAIKRKKFVKKSKGCTKSSIKHITFNDYKKCLFDLDIFRSTQRLIRSKKHSVYSIKQEKVVLSPYDDKRILLRNTTDTRPWGYAINLT